jgi:hypothetical protein
VLLDSQQVPTHEPLDVLQKLALLHVAQRKRNP